MFLIIKFYQVIIIISECVRMEAGRLPFYGLFHRSGVQKRPFWSNNRRLRVTCNCTCTRYGTVRWEPERFNYMIVVITVLYFSTAPGTTTTTNLQTTGYSTILLQSRIIYYIQDATATVRSNRKPIRYNIYYKYSTNTRYKNLESRHLDLESTVPIECYRLQI